MPRRPDPIRQTVRDWLKRATGKLALARISLPQGGFREDLCFHAQQAAELAIKAVYVHHGWPFAYIHVFGTLLDGLEKKGMQIPSSVQDADSLTVYAAETRYPGAMRQLRSLSMMKRSGLRTPW